MTMESYTRGGRSRPASSILRCYSFPAQQSLGAPSFACFAKGGKPDTPAVIGVAREPTRFVVSHPSLGKSEGWATQTLWIGQGWATRQTPARPPRRDGLYFLS